MLSRARVQIPPSPPCRRGRHVVRGDFLQKLPLTHFVPALLQTATALLGCGLVLDADPETGTPKLGTRSSCKTDHQEVGLSYFIKITIPEEKLVLGFV